MEAIFYDDAVELLGVTPGTLYHAITRKVLTKLPRRGQKQCLIKDQVLLFKGKRLSLAALSSQDRQKWQAYADSVREPIPERDDIRAIVHQEINQELAPFLQEVAFLDTEEEAAKEKLATIQGKKEGFRKALSILRARAAIA